MNNKRSMDTQHHVKRPPSVTNFFQSLLSLIAALGVFALLILFFPEQTKVNVLLSCGVLTAGLFIFNFFIRKVHRMPDSALNPSNFSPSFSRIITKLLALVFTLIIIACAYWIFPEYHSNFYAPYWYFLSVVGALAPFFIIPYFWIVDGLLRNPKDDYLHLGNVLLLKERPDWGVLRTHFGGWAIKGFFLPLMVVYAFGNAGNLISSLTQISISPLWILPIYFLAFNIIFFIDVLYSVVGYTLTLKLFGTHIRSVQPTTLGWIVALMCYEPFWSFFYAHYFTYDNSFGWTNWLSPHPFALAFWGFLIIFFLLIYVASTVSFGQRFSNLTHRGIITGGPYRFSKHPAYISKNISYWLMAIPFLSYANPVFAINACILLGGVNIIYFIRAKTEEKHLLADPVYQEYATWISLHGFFAGIIRFMEKLIQSTRKYRSEYT